MQRGRDSRINRKTVLFREMAICEPCLFLVGRPGNDVDDDDHAGSGCTAVDGTMAA